jgi:hypothetical protein
MSCLKYDNVMALYRFYIAFNYHQWSSINHTAIYMDSYPDVTILLHWHALLEFHVYIPFLLKWMTHAFFDVGSALLIKSILIKHSSVNSKRILSLIPTINLLVFHCTFGGIGGSRDPRMLRL